MFNSQAILQGFLQKLCWWFFRDFSQILVKNFQNEFIEIFFKDNSRNSFKNVSMGSLRKFTEVSSVSQNLPIYCMDYLINMFRNHHIFYHRNFFRDYFRKLSKYQKTCNAFFRNSFRGLSRGFPGISPVYFIKHFSRHMKKRMENLPWASKHFSLEIHSKNLSETLSEIVSGNSF